MPFVQRLVLFGFHKAHHFAQFARRPSPVLFQPVEFSAQQGRLQTLVFFQQDQGFLFTVEVGQGSRHQVAALQGQVFGKVGGFRVLQGLQGFFRFAVEDADQGQLGADPRLFGPLQPELDLVLQQLGTPVQKVDGNQPVGQHADHLVALGAGRRQFAELVIKGDGGDRLQGVGLAFQVEAVKGVDHFLADLGGVFVGAEVSRRLAQGAQAGTEIAGLHVEVAETPEQVEFEIVAAPGEAQFFHFDDRFLGGHAA